MARLFLELVIIPALAPWLICALLSVPDVLLGAQPRRRAKRKIRNKFA